MPQGLQAGTRPLPRVVQWAPTAHRPGRRDAGAQATVDIVQDSHQPFGPAAVVPGKQALCQARPRLEPSQHHAGLLIRQALPRQAHEAPQFQGRPFADDADWARAVRVRATRKNCSAGPCAPRMSSNPTREGEPSRYTFRLRQELRRDPPSPEASAWQARRRGRQGDGKAAFATCSLKPHASSLPLMRGGKQNGLAGNACRRKFRVVSTQRSQRSQRTGRALGGTANGERQSLQRSPKGPFLNMGRTQRHAPSEVEGSQRKMEIG